MPFVVVLVIITFSGVSLQDLIFIEEGNADQTPDNKINWQKRTLLYTILQQFLENQNYCRFLLGLKDKEMKESFLRRISRADEITDAEMRSMSLEIEPRVMSTHRKKEEKPRVSLKAMREAIADITKKSRE